MSNHVTMSVRRLAATAFLLAGIGSWLPLVERTATAPAVWALCIAAVMMLAGFGALDVLRTPTQPLTPLRVSLAIALVVDLLMIVTLPTPWRPSTVVAAVAGAIAVAVVAATMLLLRTHPRLAFGLLVLSAIFGVQSAQAVAQGSLSPEFGASMKDQLFLVAISAAANIAAAWHGRFLWRASTGQQGSSEHLGA